MASGIPSFFKTPKHRSFDYKPMFYDEQKERKLELERLAKEAKNGVEGERRVARLRTDLRQRWHAGSRSSRKQHQFNQRIRLIVIMAVLCGLIWLFFNWA